MANMVHPELVNADLMERLVIRWQLERIDRLEAEAAKYEECYQPVMAADLRGRARKLRAVMAGQSYEAVA